MVKKPKVLQLESEAEDLSIPEAPVPEPVIVSEPVYIKPTRFELFKDWLQDYAIAIIGAIIAIAVGLFAIGYAGHLTQLKDASQSSYTQGVTSGITQQAVKTKEVQVKLDQCVGLTKEQTETLKIQDGAIVVLTEKLTLTEGELKTARSETAKYKLRALSVTNSADQSSIISPAQSALAHAMMVDALEKERK